MFTITKQVINCNDCPHMEFISGFLAHGWCGKEQRQLPSKDWPKIPEWCSLNNEIEPE